MAGTHPRGFLLDAPLPPDPWFDWSECLGEISFAIHCGFAGGGTLGAASTALPGEAPCE